MADCNLKDSESIIERAIKNEEEAYESFMELCSLVEDPEA